jgi:hypothetical protein
MDKFEEELTLPLSFSRPLELNSIVSSLIINPAAAGSHEAMPSNQYSMVVK